MYSQVQEVNLFISAQTHKDVERCILWSASELLYWHYVCWKACQIISAYLLACFVLTCMCVHACVQANMLTCAHAYTHTRLHACAYMIARLYCLICNLYNTIVFTCLLTNLRCTEDSNRTVLGGQDSVGTRKCGNSFSRRESPTSARVALCWNEDYLTFWNEKELIHNFR